MHYLTDQLDEETDTTTGKSKYACSFVIPFRVLVLFAVFMLSPVYTSYETLRTDERKREVLMSFF